ncbi:MAG: hypothetical protein BRC31_08995 [Actinobacteria bacterium QS_5_72_10]|nr:MAG: hypothetical protein BRC31_08995 [Actinobacteria bacterium QS_5_72_10]
MERLGVDVLQPGARVVLAQRPAQVLVGLKVLEPVDGGADRAGELVTGHGRIRRLAPGELGMGAGQGVGQLAGLPRQVHVPQGLLGEPGELVALVGVQAGHQP